MDVYNPGAFDSPAPALRGAVHDDEIDLRRYIELMILWWREIFLFTLIIAAISAGVAYYLEATSQPLYSTSADVVIARVVSEVNMVDSFRTTSQEPDQPLSLNARRESLVQLASSATIAEAVIAELGDQLDDREKIPAVLASMVSAESPGNREMNSISDLIRITVVSPDPEKAALITNSWTKHYVNHVNLVYGQYPEQTLSAVEEQLQEAEIAYQNIQKEYEAFIADNRIPELQRQIDEKSRLRAGYMEVRNSDLDAQKNLMNALIEQDRSMRQRLFSDLVSTQANATLKLFNVEAQEQLDRVTELLNARDTVRGQLSRARSLRQQLIGSENPRSPGNILAVEIFKTQIYVLNDSIPVNLMTDISSLVESEDSDPVADIDALIQVLEGRLANIEDALVPAKEALLNGDTFEYLEQVSPEKFVISASTVPSQTIAAGEEAETLTQAIYQRYLDLFDMGQLAQISQASTLTMDTDDALRQIEALEKEIQQLNAELAAEQARQQLLNQERDLAWDTYKTLRSKVVELSLSLTAANSIVRTGTKAYVPTSPIRGPSLLLITAAAGTLGLILAVVLVFIADIMGKGPILAGRQAA